ncbi:MAG: SRPBCC family protein, partial [Gammaproteobacteria bacterium]
MQVNLEKSFPLEASPAAAWKVLQDIEAVAGCMPGAEITEKVDDSHYKGQVRLKVGPASATFKGDIEVRGLDVDQRELRLFGKGADTKGTSTASMELTARVLDVEGRAELVGTSQVSVSGKMASFGGRMMNQVSAQILQQFGANFA